MTATVVNGLAVIADEPTESPIKDRAGGTVLWQQTRTLLLEDGNVVYGCVHCDYTAPTAAKVRPHLGSHKERKPRGKPVPTPDLTLSELLAKVEQLEVIEADRDQWKARALKAERAMATLRRALNGD